MRRPWPEHSRIPYYSGIRLQESSNLSLSDTAKTPKLWPLAPTAALIASGSDDQTIKIWDAQTGRIIHTLIGHDHSVLDVAFSPDSTRVVSTDAQTDRLWDVGLGTELATLGDHLPGTRMTFSPDGQMIAMIQGRAVKAFDACSGRLIWTRPGT